MACHRKSLGESQTLDSLWAISKHSTIFIQSPVFIVKRQMLLVMFKSRVCFKSELREVNPICFALQEKATWPFSVWVSVKSKCKSYEHDSHNTMIS